MKYYYLIASLPELSLRAEKLPVQRGEFEERVHANCVEDDIALYRIISLPVDERFSCSVENAFIKDYFAFERNVRNVSTGVNMRKLRRQYAGKIVGGDDFIPDAVRSSNLPDFGLGKELPFAGKIIEFIEAEKYLNLEHYLDLLRFEIIDELNRFNYFTIEQVLGYSLKLEILERWIALTDEKGKEKLSVLSGKDIGKTEHYKIL